MLPPDRPVQFVAQRPQARNHSAESLHGHAMSLCRRRYCSLATCEYTCEYTLHDRIASRFLDHHQEAELPPSQGLPAAVRAGPAAGAAGGGALLPRCACPPLSLTAVCALEGPVVRYGVCSVRSRCRAETHLPCAHWLILVTAFEALRVPLRKASARATTAQIHILRDINCTKLNRACQE